MPFIDIHCHILPGIDDGPENIGQSIALARALVAGGVTQVFATPHHIPGTAWSASVRQVRQLVNDLQQVLQQKNIPLSVHPGMEIALHPYLLKELRRNELLPLGHSNCYLLEPPFQDFRNDLTDVLLAFKKTGYDVILAHPERNPLLKKKVDLLQELVKQGIMLQVNAGSLLGKFGQQSAETAFWLARHNCLHFVASDAHDAVRRPPPGKKEYRQLNKILGTETVKAVCYTHPARL
jgi:protein-tyrosine phosphatase